MSTLTEIPEVNNAIQKLLELADRIRNIDFGFNENDIDNIDKVIDALHELEVARKSVHEDFEKETIRSCVLRHQLKVLPGQIREEIMKAVLSARLSNSNALVELQEKLKVMNSNITNLEHVSDELEQEILVLQPTKALLKQQHDEIICQLNERMSGKASLQILLNETRDDVRQANQDVVDLEDGILQLKEELIQERMEARQEKKELTVAANETAEKTRLQKDDIVSRKKELDIAQENLTECEGNILMSKAAFSRYESSRVRLEEEERILALQLTYQQKLNDENRIHGTDIMNKRIKEEQNFLEKQKELQENICQFRADIKSGIDEMYALKIGKEQLVSDVEIKEKLKAEDAKEISELDAELQDAKAMLNEKAVEVGMVQRETMQMNEDIMKLAESHRAIVSQLNRQIEEYRAQLSKERKERLDIQSRKEEVIDELENLKMNSKIFMTEITSTIQQRRAEYQKLSDEGSLLQKALRQDEEDINSLTVKLRQLEDKYKSMLDDYTKRTNTVELEVQSLEADLAEKKRQLEEITPVYKDLELYFGQRCDEYSCMKKAVVVMKNKKLSLEDQLKKTNMEMEALKKPQEQLRTELKDKHQVMIEQMTEHGRLTQAKEEQIVEAGCKLRVVMEENERFEQSCGRYLVLIADLQRRIMENNCIATFLEDDVEIQRSDIAKMWREDSNLQEIFASKNETIAEAIEKLLNRTKRRENTVDIITERLKEELKTLSDFLADLSQRRPGQGLQFWKVVGPVEVENAPYGANSIHVDVPAQSVDGEVKNWVTSYSYGKLIQMIDLLAEGCSQYVLDDIKLPIVCSVWYARRWDCGAFLQLDVELLSDANQILHHFHRKTLDGMQSRLWHKVEHTFRDYPRGVRIIRVTIGGKDKKFWAGKYGAKFTLPVLRFVLDG